MPVTELERSEISKVVKGAHRSSGDTSNGTQLTGQPVSRNRRGTEPYAGWCESCALQAHEIQQPEMAAPAKPSQQLGTESCVVSGNGHCEA
jgi:hypothetical protein